MDPSKRKPSAAMWTFTTGDGHIKVDGAKGQIKLRTGDGSIEGRDLDGRSRRIQGRPHHFGWSL